MEGWVTLESDDPQQDVDNYCDFPFEEVDWEIVDQEVVDYEEYGAQYDEPDDLVTDLADVLEDLMGSEGDEPQDNPESRKIWKRARDLIERARE